MSGLRLGSRASALARVQAEWVAARLPTPACFVWIKSAGDADRATALTAFGGTGIFTKALHEALLEDRIDAAVHSLKDLPAAEEAGIHLACVTAREDPHDALVARDGLTFATLPPAARVGTGSPRRIAQLRRVRPDLVFETVRGNVPTRVAAVREGRLDAVVLAVAGLRRLALDHEISEVFAPEVCLPAAGQGALGLTTRADDSRSADALHPVRDVRTAAATTAERAALHALGAGCHTPVGALATVADGRVTLVVRVLSADGAEVLEHSASDAVSQAAALGRTVADALRAEGAEALLAP